MTTLREQDAAAYLRRIGGRSPQRPDARSLAALQLAHLLCVPFENLDIHRGVPIVLDVEAIVAKVVHGSRGGYCYELNSAFAALLTTIGYRVDLVAARVAHADGGYGPAFAHMTLVVRGSDDDAPWLVDVGFGDAFTKPMPLVAGREQADRDRMVRLVCRGRLWIYEEDRGEGWRARYSFTTEPRRLADFAAMNEWQQTSPDSHFTPQTICSLLTVEGRITISGHRLITTVAGGRNEVVLNPEELENVLRDRFGVRLALSP
jgi:N-hydroxyarylamine O-acetyltransferase